MRTIMSVLSIWLVFAMGGTGLAAENRETQSNAEVQTVVESNNEFALSLLAELRTQEGNLFLSPFSISTALAMTYAGARGATASQMAGALHLSLRDEPLHRAFGTLVDSLNARGKAGGYQLSVANALWGQSGFEFLKTYTDLTESSYGAALKKVDFAGGPESARRVINEWVEKKTKEKIKDLLQPGVVSEATRLILTNAVYFKGDWDSKFDEKRTADAPFFLLKGDSVEVPTMHQTSEFGYMEHDDFQAIDMPYANGELSMIVILPREVGGIKELEVSLSQEMLSEWVSEFHKQRVHVYLPKFKMTSQFELNRVLASMGMTHAFDPSLADFSGMTGRRDLFISVVVHKAFIDVNEEGTEAAAATGVVMKLTVARPGEKPIPVFRADHPLILLIRDNRTGSVLFIGRLMNPLQ